MVNNTWHFYRLDLRNFDLPPIHIREKLYMSVKVKFLFTFQCHHHRFLLFVFLAAIYAASCVFSVGTLVSSFYWSACIVVFGFI